MTLEQNVLLFLWTAGIVSAVFFVPKQQKHAFLLALLVCQGVGWMIQTFLVHWELIAYPIREFPYASELGVSEQLITHPVCSGLYVIYEPARRHWSVRGVYFILCVGVITLFDGIVEQYTELLEYTGFHWYYSALYFCLLFTSARLAVRWFFHDRQSLAAEKADLR